MQGTALLGLMQCSTENSNFRIFQNVLDDGNLPFTLFQIVEYLERKNSFLL